MDPTAMPAGSVNVVSANDLQALDVIGWDAAVSPVPEPSAWVMAGLAITGLGWSRQRRGRQMG